MEKGDGHPPTGDEEGDGPPAYLGGSAAGGPSPAAGALMVGGQPPASAADEEESDEDLIDLPDLIPQDDDELGFERLFIDQGALVVGSGEMRIMLVLYVDDLLIAWRSHESSAEIKERLKEHFKMRDLGSASF